MIRKIWRSDMQLVARQRHNARLVHASGNLSLMLNANRNHSAGDSNVHPALEITRKVAIFISKIFFVVWAFLVCVVNCTRENHFWNENRKRSLEIDYPNFVHKIIYLRRVYDFLTSFLYTVNVVIHQFSASACLFIISQSPAIIAR